MTSERQIEANRRNAQKSTGPRTPGGKAAVSLNSLQHGLRAKRTVLPGECEEDFYQLCADLEAGWQPETRTQQLLLEEMAVAQWKLQRFEAYENQIMAKGVLNKEKMALLVQLFQQQSRLKNSFLKSMHELERLQKNRAIPDAEPAPAEDTTPASSDQPAGDCAPPVTYVMSAENAEFGVTQTQSAQSPTAAAPDSSSPECCQMPAGNF